MARLIDADALRALYEKALQFDPHEYIPPSEVIADIEAAPTIEAKPVVHGEIIETIENGKMKRVFSCCNTVCTQLTMWLMPNFCPNCGADMRERKET